jgi:hypothetical protein
MASDWFQLYGMEIAINAGYNKRTGMSEDYYAVIQFWDALLSTGHTHSLPQTIASSYGRHKTPSSPGGYCGSDGLSVR